MADFQEVLDNSIKAYRHKETLPITFDAATVADLARAARDGLRLGMPSIGVTSLVDRMLVEGRADAGTNEYNSNNPVAKKIYETMLANGHSRVGATYVAAVVDKDQVAKRLGISFDEAWNGTGKTAFGRTGKDHAIRSAQMAGASKDPRNTDLVSYMSRVAAGKLTRKEHLATLNDEALVGMVYGTAAGKDGSGVEYLMNEHSPFAAAYQREVKAVTGKPDSLYLNNGKDTIDGPARMRWETDARSVLADTIRSNLGIRRNIEHTSNTRASIAGNSQLQQVFQNLAEQAIQSLGIKPEDRK